MALTNDEKLVLFKRAVSLYVDELKTWTAAKNLITGMTKAKFQNFVKAEMIELQGEALSEADLNTDLATTQAQKASDIEALGLEVEDV